MTPDPKKEAQAWLDQAQADLRQAKDNIRLRHHNLVCFLAQQAAEKALKAVLYCAGSKRIMVHGVQQLSRLVVTVVPEYGTIMETAALLDKYYIAARYPNGLAGGVPYKSFSIDDANGAVAAAEKVVQFAEQTIRRLLGE